MTETNITRVEANQVPANTQEESKPALPASEEKAYLSGDVEIVDTQIEENNDRFAYELKLTYPQIANPKTLQERKFNSHMQEMMKSNAKGFNKFCAKNMKYPNGTERKGDFSLSTTYKVLYASKELLSINITQESFTGYLNSDWSTMPITYDLKRGSELELADLFKPKAKFLDVISSYCLNELKRRNPGCGGIDGTGSWNGVVGNPEILEGTLPKAENYSGWNLARSGIQITFGEYQIGPGCLGLITVVVPYDHLREILREAVRFKPVPPTCYTAVLITRLPYFNRTGA
ncbi:MAG: DUF3298 and DUF4163 domain-containing protein [Pyrinomonadaceae bacterium MAG19_C2-C3]|nr:DUF3298 and DUF4163 domain-containing protein [Pyrinomonadaceae bacterium MAG19_C2-C3]